MYETSSRYYLFTSFGVVTTLCCARWIKKIERMLNDAGGIQPHLGRLDLQGDGTTRFSSFVQGKFVDNIPRLPARIINHLFPMN